MNFQKIPPIESERVILELAFKRAREKGKSKNLKGNWLQIIRQKESLKLDVVKDDIVKRLDKALKSFPNSDALSPFYNKLMKLTLDYPLYKKSLGALNWAIKKIRFFHKSYVHKVVKEKDRKQITNLLKQFYGRVSSIIKQINRNLLYLEECRKIMRSYPDVKDMFTVCIYGFPNVGKTTLLNRLTGSSAEVASYAFTTKSINSGFLDMKGQKIQFLDVPGTLARKEKMNKIELQAELVKEELADVIIYVFDLSDTSGYSTKQQEQLYQNIVKKNFGERKSVLVYLSKLDLIGKKILDQFKHKHSSLKELKSEVRNKAKTFSKME